MGKAQTAKAISRPASGALAVFGALGLIPFWAPLLAPFIWPQWSGAANLQLAYGGLILSFLGGVRLGRALNAPEAFFTIALSMLPSIGGLVVAALPVSLSGPRYAILVLGFALMWWWDRSSKSLPGWYRRLRTPLTVCAIAALAVGAVWLGYRR
ncbi:MAG: DUF3429 domain-containing protein [Pseudomonadota bacterium]|nr:DUF3429 domain-containing protein [Pseudomonadota bacterium]